jgi:hypothetical protein
VLKEVGFRIGLTWLLLTIHHTCIQVARAA